jgi:hypothetical protein
MPFRISYALYDLVITSSHAMKSADAESKNKSSKR